MKVIIPAAGYATRLYPLTKDRPKALLQVKGKPILEHIIRRIEELPDVEEIFIVTNSKFYKNFADWLKGFKSQIPVKVLNDGTTSNENRLGQVGDIQFVVDKEKIDDELLVVAGDNLFNFSLLPALNFFRERKTIVNALWDSRSLEVAREQGIAVIDNKGKIVLFQEKDPNPKSTLTSLGIYFFPKEQVKLLKRFISQGNNADKMGYFMIWLIKNSAVYGYVYHEKWFDIGWPSALERARDEFVP
jgi:glucose-1-phosphate thymidylyltransferase